LRGQPKKLFIGGRWVEAASGKTFETLNPATGEVLAKVAEGGADDIDRAVAAARASFDRGTWRDLPPSERAKVLWQVGDMIEERATEFAQLETLDNGMPINDALLFHAPLAAATFRYYAGWVTKLDGATQQVSLPGRYLSYTLREPVGVVGQIIAWNFPLLMAAWKVAPALACGNSAVLTRAVSGAFFGIFFNQGQVCSAGSRLFVQKKVYDETLDELLKTVKETRIGPGIDPVTQMGPLVSKAQQERVLGYITLGNKEGARMLSGGGRPAGLEGGYFVEPTVFADVDGRMTIAREEIFGPVLSAIPFDDEDDLVAKANSTIYGLVAGVWTSDVARAHRVAH